MGWRRLLLAWAAQALVLYLVAWLIPGIEVHGFVVALLGALVLGLLNALVRPILIMLTLPLTVVTAGLLSLLINAVILAVAAPIVPGFEISSLWAAIAAATVMTVFSTIVGAILSSDQDETFFAELSRRLASSDRDPVPGGRGLVIVQVDGLAAPILRNAIRVGLTPTMARWVRSGDYRLIEWYCTPPSQTSSSQAGILHGNNDDIPAFRWYEKTEKRLMVSNRPGDAAEIERRISNGEGLLAGGGMSANNLFSGDAPRTIFTMSKIRDPSTAADVDAFSLYFVDPAAFIRTIVLTIGELLKEWREARRQRMLDIEPRVHRGRNFAVLRAATNVLLRDLNITFLMNAIGRGAPIMYVDFVDYDELAHHAGPERLESLASLTGVDRALASIARATEGAPRDYDVVVVSDHGQSQGATFLQRYGYTLEAYIRDLMGGTASVTAPTAKGEGWGPVNALLTQVANRPGLAGRATASALGSRRVDDSVELGEKGDVISADETPDVVVGASGNLANVYFLPSERRLSLEEIESRSPGLVDRLVAHPGIGFVLVRSDAHGPLAIGAKGVDHLADGQVDGTDPLTPFGPRAAEDLRRLDSFEHVGDLLVNSLYDTELDEVAAFEELVGSHGGFGGPQTRPFVLAPARLPYDGQQVIGASGVYRLLRGWADQLGVGPKSGATDAPLADQSGLRPARGLWVVAALTGLTSVLWTLLGVLFVLAGFGLAGSEYGAEYGIAGAVILVLGLAGLLVTRGLWKRRGWARMAAIAWYAIGVLQALAALGSEGLGGLFSAGLTSVLIAFGVFFYLTRPHVAAAFRRQAEAE